MRIRHRDVIVGIVVVCTMALAVFVSVLVLARQADLVDPAAVRRVRFDGHTAANWRTLEVEDPATVKTTAELVKTAQRVYIPRKARYIGKLETECRDGSQAEYTVLGGALIRQEGRVYEMERPISYILSLPGWREVAANRCSPGPWGVQAGLPQREAKLSRRDMHKERLYADYLAYRMSRGRAQRQWARVLRRDLRPCHECGKREIIRGGPDPWLTFVANYSECASVDDLRQWVREHDDIVKEMHSAGMPAGPLPLEKGSTFYVKDTPEPGCWVMLRFADLLLADAALAADKERILKSMQAYDHLVRLLATSHETMEILAARNMELKKWYFVLQAAQYDPSRFRRVVRSSQLVLTREDIAATLLEYERRLVLYGGQCDLNCWAPRALTESELIAVDDEYRKVSKLALSFTGMKELRKYASSLEDSPAWVVFESELACEIGELKLLADWLYIKDLERLAKAVYSGDAQRVTNAALSVIKIRKLPDDPRHFEASCENPWAKKKWEFWLPK